jgi:hypothetical protein
LSSFKEEAVNGVAGGAIAGIGVGPDGEPGVNRAPLLRRRRRRRKKFAENVVFVLKSEDYLNCLTAKTRTERYSKYIKDQESLDDIVEYSRKNPAAPIMVEDETTGAMTYLRLGRSNGLHNMYGR